MPALAKRRIPNVVFGLSIFWGGLLTPFFWTTGFNFKFLLPWGASICAGMWVAHVQTKEYKKNILSSLKYRHHKNLPVADRSAFLNIDRGVLSSLGPVPFHEKALPRVQSYSFHDLQRHCPPELVAGDAFSRIFGKFLSQQSRDDYAVYLALFDALAMTLLHPDNLKVPAGIDRHSGRSLLSHSLLLCGLMIQRASAYIYIPTHGMAAIDAGFKLDPSDPLISIVAMSHDIGKIRKMVVNDTGTGIELLPGHAAQSARDVAQLSEFWSEQISIEDRRIVQCALVYTSKWAECPVQKKKGNGQAIVTSDRLHAIMGLLAECDRISGSIEMGGKYNFNEAPKLVVTVAQVDAAVEPVNLLNMLSMYLVMSMSVNVRAPLSSVGFKCKDSLFSRDRHVVIIDELEFVKSFAKFMDKPELETRDGKSSTLTKKVLELLDEHGFLFRVDEPVHLTKRPATSCLYKIEFRDANAPPVAEPDIILLSSFLIDVTEWPSMAKLQAYPNYDSIPTFAGFRLGRQPAKISKLNTAFIEAESSNMEVKEMDKTVIVPLEMPIKKTPNAEKIIGKIGRALFNRTIKIAVADESVLAIVGFDDFFRDLGLQIEHYDILPDTISQLGIVQITRSVKNPETHVIKLDQSIYSKFVVNSRLVQP